MNNENLIKFFELCTFINLGVLACATILLTAFKKQLLFIHSRILKMDDDKLSDLYLRYLAYYKIAFFILNLVPYISLRIMS